MEKEVDLRSYLQVLIKKWKWILGFSVLAVILTFIGTSFLTPTYRATALVTIAIPRETVLASLTSEEVNPQFQTISNKNLLFKGYAELALSDQVLTNVLENLDPIPGDMHDVSSLRAILKARSGEDPSLLRLSASYSDPEMVATITNLWASLFVPWANEVYGITGEEQVRFFEIQLLTAAQDLEVAEEDLIEFQSSNNVTIIGNELASSNQRQADYLALKSSLIILEQDIRSLRDLLAEERGNDLAFSDGLTAIGLQLRAFNVDTAVPFQISMDSAESLTGKTREEQIVFLDNLADLIQDRISQIDEELARLEPTILALQKEVQEIETENNRLERNRISAEETYTALSRKVQEEYISSQEISSGVRLASKATVPSKPVEPRRLILSVIAGMFVFFATSFAILIMYWLQTASSFTQND